MDQKTIVLCIAGGAVALVLLSLAWSRLSAWLAARELRHAYQARPLFSAHERAAFILYILQPLYIMYMPY